MAFSLYQLLRPGQATDGGGVTVDPGHGVGVVEYPSGDLVLARPPDVLVLAEPGEDPVQHPDPGGMPGDVPGASKPSRVRISHPPPHPPPHPAPRAAPPSFAHRGASELRAFFAMCFSTRLALLRRPPAIRLFRAIGEILGFGNE